MPNLKLVNKTKLVVQNLSRFGLFSHLRVIELQCKILGKLLLYLSNQLNNIKVSLTQQK